MCIVIWPDWPWPSPPLDPPAPPPPPAPSERPNEERLHGRPDPAQFKRDVLPGLVNMTLRQMQAATDLSRALCTKIRRGDLVPHPRYWEALRRIN